MSKTYLRKGKPQYGTRIDFAATKRMRNKKKRICRCAICQRFLIKEPELIFTFSHGFTQYVCMHCASAIHLGVNEINKMHATTNNKLKTDSGENKILSTTPQSIYNYLNDFVVGQECAKKAISVAIYNHYKRIKMKHSENCTLEKSNILMIGPTGSGKTYIAKTAARLLNVPFVIVDATSMTEAGYIGDDVETILEKLLINANGNVSKAEKGIVYIDEIDKIAAAKGNSANGDISRGGVQYALLKIIEGTKVRVSTKTKEYYGTNNAVEIDTSDILFICGGAFDGLQKKIKEKTRKLTYIGFNTESVSPIQEKTEKITNEDLADFGMIPELLGRLPVKITLDELTKDDLIKIITEPKDAIMKQYQKLLQYDGVTLNYTEEALQEIAQRAIKEKSGARGIRAIMEEIMADVMFAAPCASTPCDLIINEDDVRGITRPDQRLKNKEVTFHE